VNVFTHTHTYMYMIFDTFYISRFIVLPSVDHLNVNKLLTTDYSFIHFIFHISLYR